MKSAYEALRAIMEVAAAPGYDVAAFATRVHDIAARAVLERGPDSECEGDPRAPLSEDCSLLREWETGKPCDPGESGYEHEMNRYGIGALGNSVVNIDHATVQELVRQARLSGGEREGQPPLASAGVESFDPESPVDLKRRIGFLESENERLRQELSTSTAVSIQKQASLRAQLRERPNPEDFDADFVCPECQSFGVYEIAYADDFGSMKCGECNYAGSPGEDFPTMTKIHNELLALRERPTREIFEAVAAELEDAQAELVEADASISREEALEAMGEAIEKANPNTYTVRSELESWLDAVLAKRGEPELKPNTEYVTRRKDGQWHVEARRGEAPSHSPEDKSTGHFYEPGRAYNHPEDCPECDGTGIQYEGEHPVGPCPVRGSSPLQVPPSPTPTEPPPEPHEHPPDYQDAIWSDVEEWGAMWRARCRYFEEKCRELELAR